MTCLPTDEARRADPGRTLVPDNIIADRRMEFVTVVYNLEAQMLRLQARSIQHFASADLVTGLHIILNEDEPAALRSAIESFADQEYGWAAKRLHFWNARELEPDIDPNIRGWRRQQSLKLAIAENISASRYIVLDAKNHFIKPAGPDLFYTHDGRFRSFTARRTGLLQNHLRNCLRYFTLSESLADGRVMPATTPYGLYSPIVRALRHTISTREAMSFAEFFHSPKRDMTEFFLYYAFLQSEGFNVDRLYAFGKRYAATLFGKFPETTEGERQVLDAARSPEMGVFGLHRARLAKLHADNKAVVLSLWTEAGLFATTAEADAFFNAMRENAS